MRVILLPKSSRLKPSTLHFYLLRLVSSLMPSVTNIVLILLRELFESQDPLFTLHLSSIKGYVGENGYVDMKNCIAFSMMFSRKT